MTVYTAGYDDDLNLHDAPLINSSLNLVLTEKGYVGTAFYPGYGLTLTQNLLLTLASSYTWTAGGLISETGIYGSSFTPNTKYAITLAEIEYLASQLSQAVPVTLTQNMTLHDAAQIVLGVLVTQNMKLIEVDTVNLNFGQIIAEEMFVNAALSYFLTLSLTQNMSLHDAASINYQAVASVSQNMTLAGMIGNTMTFNVIDNEHMTFTEIDILKMIFSGDPLTDQMLITALYVSPNGEYTTFAINTRTNAITEYQNWVFNSFASMGRKYIAADSNGLYELDGERDEKSNIISTLQTGMMQLSGSKLAGVKGMYLGMDVTQGDNNFYVKLVAGDQREYVYKVTSQPGLMTTKVNIGKGLRSRYFSFQLQNDGSDFNLDTIEFVPMVGQRRV